MRTKDLIDTVIRIEVVVFWMVTKSQPFRQLGRLQIGTRNGGNQIFRRVRRHPRQNGRHRLKRISPPPTIRAKPPHDFSPGKRGKPLADRLHAGKAQKMSGAIRYVEYTVSVTLELGPVAYQRSFRGIGQRRPAQPARHLGVAIQGKQVVQIRNLPWPKRQARASDRQDLPCDTENLGRSLHAPRSAHRKDPSGSAPLEHPHH